MIRVVVFLLLVAMLAMGAAWMADRPGEVTILWLGRRIETSVLVAAAGIALLAALTIFAWSLARLVVRSPRMVRHAVRERRREKAHRAISRGLIAIGAGDARTAQKFAAEAGRLAPRDPLALLLSAQVAQVKGDRAAAEQAFHAMAQRSDTKLIGLRGLHVEAERRDDTKAARHYAESAAASAPALPWAGQAVLRDCCADGDWAGALGALERIRGGGLIDRAGFRRQRAVLLAARARAAAATDASAARAYAVEAAQLAPGLVPAAALAGKLLAEGGEYRKAARILEAAWRAGPHPDLAEVYTHLRFGDTARDRLKRAESLAREPAGNREGALALARAAIDAREFAAARAALTPLTARPTQRVALMMAELEEAEHGDHGRAREWMARALRALRDPAWVADGIVSDQWMAQSPVTGEIDVFRWREPPGDVAGEAMRLLAEPAERGDVIDAGPPARPEGRGPEPAPAPMAAPAPSAPGANGPAAEAGGSPDGSAERAMPASAPPSRPQAGEAVIPLVHAPDDPGPPDTNPPAGNGRRRLFFR